MPVWLNPMAALDNLQQFLEMGGNVLLLIMVATLTIIQFRYAGSKVHYQ